MLAPPTGNRRHSIGHPGTKQSRLPHLRVQQSLVEQSRNFLTMAQASCQSAFFRRRKMHGLYPCQWWRSTREQRQCHGIAMTAIWLRRKKCRRPGHETMIGSISIAGHQFRAGRRSSRIRSKISTISQGSGPLPIPCFGILCTRLLGSQAVPASCRANHKNRPILSQQKTAGALACHPGTATAGAIRVWMIIHLHPEISSIPTRKTSSRKTFRSSGSTLFLI